MAGKKLTPAGGGRLVPEFHVLYEWGYEDTLDNQYPGIKMLLSFIFVYEEGARKLDDVYTFNDEFSSAGSLSQELSKPGE